MEFLTCKNSNKFLLFLKKRKTMSARELHSKISEHERVQEMALRAENGNRYMNIFDIIYLSMEESHRPSILIYVKKDSEEADRWFICSGAVCINKYYGRDRYLTSKGGHGHTEMEVLKNIGSAAKERGFGAELKNQAYYPRCRSNGWTLSISLP